jgi:hypothetical protein
MVLIEEKVEIIGENSVYILFGNAIISSYLIDGHTGCKIGSVLP